MSFWKKAKQAAIINRLTEEKIYEQVLREMESGLMRDGLWAKALQKSRGGEQEARALYIAYRVQSIKDEVEIAETLYDNRGTKQEIPRMDTINECGEDGYTPLMRAVKAMDIRAVMDLLERGANPKIKVGPFGTSTALSIAIMLHNRAVTLDEQNSYKAIIELLKPIS